MSNAYTRDMEELEGALLPVATKVVGRDNENSNVTSAAVVVQSVKTVYDYDAAIAREQELANESKVEAVVIPDNGTQPNYAGVSDDSKSTIERAEQTGKIRSAEERESIRRANLKVFSQNYNERNSIRLANQRAKERDRVGLAIENDRIAEQMALSEKAKAEDAKKQQLLPLQEQEQKPTGYEVKEYECGTYETKSYEVTEYKSIYD